MATYTEAGTWGKWSGDVIREDVLDIIYQITPEDTPFFNMIGDSRATDILHQWPRRSLTTRADNAQEEGHEFNINASFFAAAVLPVRVSNLTQIFRKLPRVTESFQATQVIGISDLMADQIQQRSVEFKTDVEHALLRGSINSGSSATGTARRLRGFHNMNPSNGTDLTSNASFTETLFNLLLEDIWADGGRAQDVLVNGYMKRRISSFTDSATKFFMADDRKVINTIGVYESDFFTTQIHLCRDCRNAAGDYDLYAFDRSFFAKAWLRTPKVERLPRMGDDVRAVVIAELTLEYGDQAAAGFITDAQG